MIVLCSGAPKSGTHLNLRCVSLFPGVLAVHGHVPFGDVVSQEGHVEIIRNPRNVLCSWSRASGKSLIDSIPTVIPLLQAHVGWIDAGAHVVRFEELLGDATGASTLAALGTYLGATPLADHWRRMWGGTATFTGALSDWRTQWFAGLNTEWALAGGPYLESVYGYDAGSDPMTRTAS